MTLLYKALLALLFLSLVAIPACQQDDSEDDVDSADSSIVAELETDGDTVTLVLKLDSLFDSYDLKGTIIVRHVETDTTWVYNPERSTEGFLPASTFKIVNALIGLETEIVNTTDTLFTWDGKKRRMPVWETDMTLEQAFHTSCVPCFQQVARMIGTERMSAFVNALEYGDMVVSDKTLTDFWLKGPSRITTQQQADFLERLIEGTLPVSASSIASLKEVMLLLQTDKYALYGKTGWSVEGRRNIGWFVGWYEVGQDSYVFATNVEPRTRKVPSNFMMARQAITRDVMLTIARLQGIRP